MPEWCPEGWTYSSYRIYWSDQSTGGLRMLTELNGTSYEHTGLTNGHAYRYQVVGVNRMGEGQLSEMVSCAPANVPMAPRALEAEVGTGGSVRLYWQDPTAWGSGSGRYYTVLRGEHPWEMAVVEQELSSPSWVDTTIPRHNLTYHYMVRCRTSAGDGQVAMVCMDVPPAAPAPPVSVEATAMSGRVEVTWQPPAEDGGDAVRHYNLYRTVAGGVPQLLAERLSVMCYNDTSCLYGTAYSYSVTAANAAGEGTMSTPVEAQMALPATELEGVDLDLGDIPLPALGAVAAVIIIGAVMVGRLGLRSRGRTRGDE
jgi:titin